MFRSNLQTQGHFITSLKSRQHYRGGLGVSTDLGRMYTEREREMVTAFCLAFPDFLANESPKDTPEGERAPMDGILMRCRAGKQMPEVAYIYEAKTRNFNAAKLFGEYRGRALVDTGKVLNCQKASLLFGVPSLLLLRLEDDPDFLVKRLTNADGSFTFVWNEKMMRIKNPCLPGYTTELRSFVPMRDAKTCPLKLPVPLPPKPICTGPHVIFNPDGEMGFAESVIYSNRKHYCLYCCADADEELLEAESDYQLYLENFNESI
jgi:hypothetical protein